MSWLDKWNFDSEVNIPEKKHRADKLVDTMLRALINHQTTFLMGGIGSSVMAGHDNCRYDSFGSQLERMWSPVWKAAGMDFVFQVSVWRLVPRWQTSHYLFCTPNSHVTLDFFLPMNAECWYRRRLW